MERWRAGAEAAGGPGTCVKGPGQRRAGGGSFLRLRSHTHLVDPLRPTRRRLHAASSFGLRDRQEGSGAPSNHAPPHDPRSQPPAPLPPATHCARPQWTDRGPGWGDPGRREASARISGVVGQARAGLHRPRARAVASGRWDPESGILGGVVPRLNPGKPPPRILPALILPNLYGPFHWLCFNSPF